MSSAGRRHSRTTATRVLALAIWTFGAWVLVTWSPFTVEQEAFGAGFSILIASALARFGEVARPWSLVTAPRRLPTIVALLAVALARVVVANVKLAYRIWAPRRPLASGMVIVPTKQRSDGGLTAIGLVTSLIVDNQVVDLDRKRHELQYHAVAVPEGSARQRRNAINGPIERLLRPLNGGVR